VNLAGKKSVILDAVVWTAVLVLTAYIGHHLQGLLLDDSAITFRVSLNFAQGHGLIYNIGEKYQASSAPGYALFFGFIGRIFGGHDPATVIQSVANVLSALCLGLGAAGIYELCRHRGFRFTGVIACLLFIAFPITWEAYDNEILPQIALIVWAFVLFDRNRVSYSAVLVAIATVIRPDSFLAALILIAAAIFRYHRFPFKPAAVFLVIALPFAFASYRYYGFLLPQTMAAKMARLHSHVAKPFSADAVDFLGDKVFHIYRTDVWDYAYLGGTGGLLVWLRRWAYLYPILAWTALHLFFYAKVYGVFYHWYLVPVAVMAAFLIAAILTQLKDWCLDRPRGAARTLTLTLVAFFVGYWLWEGVCFVLLVYNQDSVWIQRFFWLLCATLLAYPLVKRRSTFAKVPRVVYRGAGFVTAAYVLFVLGGWLIGYRQEFVSWESTLFWDKLQLYRDVGQWLQANARPGVRVCYDEIGIIGYEAPNVRILDPLGLGSPGMEGWIARGDEYPGAIYHFHPEIALGHPALTPGVLGYANSSNWLYGFRVAFPGWYEWFHSHYREVKLIKLSNAQQIGIFVRNDVPVDRILKDVR
jgi:hypothetical protein